ncbi:MAG: excinuclease ABC subunit UvrB [Candidatus Omnitrophica bacterium]|nr:excinuclease ABC subunit UvrB [Candidatus Omnitrophota bacterium]
MEKFKLVSKFKPCGDQPQAIKKLVEYLKSGRQFQTLLGVTGSGKTFTLANVIEKINRPILVISHNKTLAAQLYSEFKEFFPENAIEYFVSYYDYYQPEAYIPATDTYIEKDSSINDRLDRLRLSATSSLMSRQDVLIVASVSCIYNLGSPEEYEGMVVYVKRGQKIDRDELISKLISIQYERNDYDFNRGKIRVRGDVVDIFPAYKETAIRIEFFADTIEKIFFLDPISGNKITLLEKIAIYPAKHFLVASDKIAMALKSIEEELQERLDYFKKLNKFLEAQRLNQRTRYDMEMLRQLGYCHGIENYSRHLSGRPPGSRPWCLIDYFPKNFVVIIDESHVTIPQLRGMYEADKSRKEVLVEYGFRLPSCLDNRPLRFDEFEKLIGQTIFVSATPAEYELKKSKGFIVEQLVRPTGIVDPEIIIKPTNHQIEDLVREIRICASRNERVIVTTLTKRMAEDLSQYLQQAGLRVKYLHSEIQTIEREKIIRQLRSKEFDCLVGINLLREGIDLPEVSLVAILDADKEGFLRSTTSLIQVAGRAARNINGKVIMYADTVTESMRKALEESKRRRTIQIAFNKKYKITPRSIQKAIKDGIEQWDKTEKFVQQLTGEEKDKYQLRTYIAELEHQMDLASRNLQFEKAAQIRDEIKRLKEALENKSPCYLQ